ncbi:MAG: hypothetical protein Q8848_02505 [Candidatus Phytoplasma australasiaticum]|nr:hypothetical protein [Candidatus Phytoplasma australasiaticum]
MEDHAEFNDNYSHPPGNDVRIKIRRLSDNKEFGYINFLFEISPSPNIFISTQPMSMASLSHQDDFTTDTDVGFEFLDQEKAGLLLVNKGY